MPRHRPPDMTTREGRRGLTLRLNERHCICGPDDGPEDHRPDCPMWRIETRDDDDLADAGGMNTSDGLGS